MSQQRTAIVLFARDPRIEATHKRLVGRRSVAVHAALLAETAMRCDVVPDTDLVFAWEGDPDKAWLLQPRAVVGQRGRTFGAKLLNAARDVLSLGYTRLVFVGADCPSIDATLIASAARKLDDVDAVLGPATDGGVNLLALRGEALDRVDFRPLPWLTASLFKALEHSLSRAGCELAILPPADDIDSTESLGRFLREAPDSRLARLVQRALEASPEARPGGDRGVELARSPLDSFAAAFLKSPPESRR